MTTDKQKELQKINNERVLRRMKNLNDKLNICADCSALSFPSYGKIEKDKESIKKLYGVDNEPI